MVGYTRQSAGSITDGATIQASHFNNEYNQLESAFNATTGHDHSGGAGLGPTIALSGGSIGITGTLAVANGGIGATTLTDGGILLGSGTNAVTALAVLADGSIVVGDGATDPVVITAFTSSTGLLIHERGGIEANISAIADGGMVVGTGAGTMAIRTGVLTAGAAGFLTHELGGLEFNASAITTDQFLGGTSAGVIGIRTAAQVTTSLALTIGTNTQAFGAVLDDLNTLGAPASDGQFIVATAAGAFAYESTATARTSMGAQAQDAVLDDLAALVVVADNEFIVGTGAGTYAHENAATARTSMGLGTIATQASSSVSITGGTITGITDLTIADGGTGASTFTDGGVLLGSGTSAITAMAVLADGAMIVGDGVGDPVPESGATLRTSIGVGTGDAVSFSSLTLTTDLAVAEGGTGVSTLTNHGVMLGSGTGAVSVTGAGTAGQVLTSNGAAADPTFQSAGAIIQSVTNTIAAATGTTTFPNDNTTPLSSEGTQIVTQAITPADTDNKILLTASITIEIGTSVTVAIVAFRGSTAIGASVTLKSGNNDPFVISLNLEDSPASASAQTYSLRIGVLSAATWFVGRLGTDIFNGELAKNSMTLQEIVV